MILGIPSSYVYYSFLAICCGYAIYRGGRPEYFGVVIMIVGSLATVIVSKIFGRTWSGLDEGVFLVDMIALFALIHLTIVSDRFWPMWATAFHLLAVSIHTAMMVAPEIAPWAFATAAHFWAYPMLLAVAFGAHEYIRPKDQLETNTG